MKVKTLVVSCLFLAALTLPLVPAGAGEFEEYVEWYSDATKTEVVGWRQVTCGGVIADGYQTSFQQIWWGSECIEGAGGWGWGTVCQYGPPHYMCPANCWACYEE